MKKFVLLMMFVTITALLSSGARADMIVVNDYLDLSEEMQTAYMTGVAESAGYICFSIDRPLEVNPNLLDKSRGDINRIINQVMRDLRKNDPAVGGWLASSTIQYAYFTRASYDICDQSGTKS